MMTRFAGLVALMTVAGSCGTSSPGATECSSSTQCNLESGGVCADGPSGSWCQYDAADCPSGLRWSDQAGDGLAGQCVAGGEQADAAPPDAVTIPDATPPPVQSHKIFVAAQNEDSLFVFDANDLSSQPTVSLPDRDGVGNVAIGLAGDTLWITSNSDIVAFDPGTLEKMAGFPQHVTDCVLSRVAFSPSGMYCQKLGGTGEADDGIQRWLGAPAVVTSHADIPGPWIPAASNSRVVVPSGSFYRTVAVLDAALVPVEGSPIIAATPYAVDKVAVSDAAGRIAVTGSSVPHADIQLFDRDTLQAVGLPADLPAKASGLVFDDEGMRLVVGLADGSMVTFSAVDMASGGAPLSVSTHPIYSIALDKTRGRIYALSGDQLLVLDASTLQPVTGSPINLPSNGIALAFY